MFNELSERELRLSELYRYSVSQELFVKQLRPGDELGQRLSELMWLICFNSNHRFVIGVPRQDLLSLLITRLGDLHSKLPTWMTPKIVRSQRSKLSFENSIDVIGQLYGYSFLRGFKASLIILAGLNRISERDRDEARFSAQISASDSSNIIEIDL